MALLAWAIRFPLDPWIGAAQPFFPFPLAVALAALWLGWRPAFLTGILGLFLALGSFVAPRQADWSGNPVIQVQIVTYCVMTATIIYILSRLRTAQQASAVQQEAAQRQRQQAESMQGLFEGVFLNAQLGLCLLNSAGKFIKVNPAGACMLGYTPGELEGRSMAEFLKPEKLMSSVQRLNALFGGEVVEPRELPLVTKDGSVRYAQVGASRVNYHNGETLVLVVAADITYLKEAEQAVQEAQHQLAQMNEELEQKVQERTVKLQETVEELEHFSYSITHDMRAPLRAMQSFGNLLQMECGETLSSSGQDYLRRIVSAAARMDRLIQDTLNYSKVMRADWNMEPVNVVTLLRGMVETYPNLQPPMAEIEIDPRMPLVRGNEAALTQCFSNLLNNAVKFVEPGRIPKVRVWAEARPGFVRLWFADNGIGIPANCQERIFGMFQRLNKEYDGTGIGLAIVHKVVQRLGGQVGVESEPGNGSRFWLDLQPENKSNGTYG